MHIGKLAEQSSRFYLRTTASFPPLQGYNDPSRYNNVKISSRKLNTEYNFNLLNIIHTQISRNNIAFVTSIIKLFQFATYLSN